MQPRPGERGEGPPEGRHPQRSNPAPGLPVEGMYHIHCISSEQKFSRLTASTAELFKTHWKEGERKLTYLAESQCQHSNFSAVSIQDVKGNEKSTTNDETYILLVLV